MPQSRQNLGDSVELKPRIDGNVNVKTLLEGIKTILDKFCGHFFGVLRPQ